MLLPTCHRKRPSVVLVPGAHSSWNSVSYLVSVIDNHFTMLCDLPYFPFLGGERHVLLLCIFFLYFTAQDALGNKGI